MKKLIFGGLMLIFTLSIPLTSIADGENRTRNDCNWTGWQYKSRARVNKFGVPKREVDKGCPAGNYYASVDNGCASQWAQNWYGSHYEGGSVYRMQSFCARGSTSSELYYDYFSNTTNDDDYFEHGKYSTARVQFKSHEVIMDSINIELQAKGKDLYSTFEILMWLPQNENDTIESIEKSFLHGKITLMNGEVVGTGVFENLSLTARKNSDGVYTVVVNNFKAIGKLPEGITNEKNIIEVITMSDGGIDEEYAISNALNDNTLTVNVFPNPTSDLLNITVDSNDQNESYSVTLYDLSGKIISTIESNISSNSLSNYQIHLSEEIETNGVYYILIKSNNGKLNKLQKIVYQ